MIAEVRALRASPPVLFVSTASPSQVESFFRQAWPEARAVSDERATLYQVFGLPRGSWSQMFSPRTFLRGAQATLKGHTVGRPQGDPWQLAGVFLVDPQGRALTSFRAQDAADHPRWADIPGVEV